MNIVIILFYMLERGLELLVSARNKRLLQVDHKLEVLDKREAVQMRFFHLSWFLILMIESTVAGQLNDGIFLYAIIFVLMLAQILRWTSIFTLGKYWSVDVYNMKEHAVINEGPYAYIKHPNYLAVVTEFFFLPLLLGSPVTLVLGSVVNFFMLKRRIKMEEQALDDQSSGYEKKFKGKRRFVPVSHG